MGMSNMLFYYCNLLLGPWNTLMALNRFTAIWFWKNHEWYWRNSIFIPALIVMLGYPFLVGIPVILTMDSVCFFHPFQENCIEDFGKEDFASTISNGIHVLLCAALGIITSLASRFNIIVTTPETKKLEQFLLIQSILSLIFFGFNLYYNLHGGIPDNEILEGIVEIFADSYTTFFKTSSTLLIFTLS
uniref:Serpentine receptor class gamma n=1 Tax=Panagrolaimus sp. PS1159 TaxID=55785 RepID=A0AC35FLT5_9BILA